MSDPELDGNEYRELARLVHEIANGCSPLAPRLARLNEILTNVKQPLKPGASLPSHLRLDEPIMARPRKRRRH
ncbi:MAG: hypothetical protein JO001_14345 [Alphaproteobacteria bacterium]|nr:hypothetical protein [Alphaproteobacteria bacterium]